MTTLLPWVIGLGSTVRFWEMKLKENQGYTQKYKIYTPRQGGV